jgi:hypothetical protein
MKRKVKKVWEKVICLTEKNKEIFFLIVHQPGRPFTYSMEFMTDDVRKIAARRDLEVEYQKPGTEYYKKFGSETFVIVGPLKTKIETKDYLFDPSELVT